MTQQLTDEFPGVDFNFSQYIEDNVEEAASGVKGENSVKLYGGDLEILEKTANKIKDVMATVPGIADLAVLASLGQPTVRIDVDRARAARYGLAPATSTPRSRRPSAVRRRAIFTRTAPTATSPSSSAWRPSIGKAWMPSATS